MMDQKSFARARLAHTSPGSYPRMDARREGGRQHSLCRTIIDVGSGCTQAGTAAVHSAN
jgi:hypothetical protein